MTHPFGELLTQFRTRKHGLSQARLAQLVGYDPALIAKMAKGQRELTGPSGRERVIRLIGVLMNESVIATVDEANALLSAAKMPPLFSGLSQEAGLIQQLETHLHSDPSPQSESTHNACPAPITSFIGRQRDLNKIAEWLQSARLITLTGVGGAGKTRLAIEVAHRVQHAFADGVAWIELAALQNGLFASQTIANTLGIHEVPSQAIETVLINRLRDKQQLLILDNCEHLIDDITSLAAMILTACRHIRILTTSREAFNLHGEVLWSVLPLTLPDRQTASNPMRCMQFESFQLFCERVAAVNSTFELTDRLAPLIVQICHHLDGIPLAIELAAARAKYVSIEDMLERLNDRFTFLASENKSSNTRHQTLRATIEWSYSLLTKPEQRWFRRLAVFVGNWDVKSAQRIFESDEDITSDILFRLADKSLVVVEYHQRLQRFRMLESIREFAYELLLAEDNAHLAILQKAHMLYFLQQAELAWPKEGNLQNAWAERLELDHGNFRSALDWALQHEFADEAMRMIWGLQNFWLRRRHLAEARSHVMRVLTIADPQKRTLNRAHVLSLTSQGAFHDQRYDARPMLREALAISQELGNTPFEAHVYFALGCNSAFHHDFEFEVTYFEKSLELYRKLGHKADIRTQLAFTGDGHYEFGNYNQAETYYREALSRCDEPNSERDRIQVWFGLGMVALQAGNLSRAAAYIYDGALLNQEFGMLIPILQTLEPLINLAAANGQLEQAAQLLGAWARGLQDNDLCDEYWYYPDTGKNKALISQQLGKPKFDALFAKGFEMDERQALNYALTQVDALNALY